MSSDPFANTTTVKNILNHIISPKIVKDGSGGYTTKTDLVNIDNLLFASRGSGTGTLGVPLTAQVGEVDIPSDKDTVTIYHSRVTPNSIILATDKDIGGNKTDVRSIQCTAESFTINLTDLAGSGGKKISWFIASF
jgi:hypothetical protein